MAKNKSKAKKFFDNRSFILTVAAVAFLCLSIILVIYSTSALRKTKKEMESLSQAISQLHCENESLENDIRNGISDEEIERIAREEFGYILPGERVYQDAS